ncbi:hypothetical protein RhiirA5_417512 [Rhizophagus irregularis]|uniref:Uncharacterized protein n=1 Tax=Rhizophagus irregularis TaxID=588596 RepID=A0A2N0PMF6_9GLOM|nr:hypothetical protein RhiirA5_417512 [Rhizophagus irregularis]
MSPNTTARSELEVLRQINAKLELEVWREHTSLQEEKNTELRKKLDLEVENFDLKYENAALKSKVEDVESRLVKVEQDSSAEQPQNERNQKVASADDVPDSVINTAERSENQSNNASSVDSKN